MFFSISDIENWTRNILAYLLNIFGISLELIIRTYFIAMYFSTSAVFSHWSWQAISAQTEYFQEHSDEPFFSPVNTRRKISFRKNERKKNTLSRKYFPFVEKYFDLIIIYCILCFKGIRFSASVSVFHRLSLRCKKRCYKQNK